MSEATLQPRNHQPGAAADFAEQGYSGPVRIFSPEQAHAVLALLEREAPPPVWHKGNAAASHAYFAVATLPALTSLLGALMGPDILLWGAKLVHRQPGQVHPWHTDIESSDPAGGCVSVWIGLRGVDRRSALEVVSRSHRFGTTLQERALAVGASRDGTTTEEVERWARELDPKCERIRFDMGDGEAILFDGRLWHGTNNTNPHQSRSALLLQYAVPSRTIRIPDLKRLEPPFRYEPDRPPCVVALGRAGDGENLVVPPPAPASSWVHRLRLPLETANSGDWRSRPIAAGPTPCLEHLACHASVLEPGVTPHRPHRHADEEILLVLEGEAELTIPEADGRPRTERAVPGTIAYYPLAQDHTLRNTGEKPVTYCMLKWRNGKPARDRARRTLGVEIRHAADADRSEEQGSGWTTRRIFEGKTVHLSWLHAHRSSVAPGGGYEPHVDPYDVALIVLEGSIETLGVLCEPYDFVFYAAGEPHGLVNPGPETASYLVIELHASPRSSLSSKLRDALPAGLLERIPMPAIRFARKVLDRIPF